MKQREAPNNTSTKQTPTAQNKGYISSFASINATFASSAAAGEDAAPLINGTLTEVACAPQDLCTTDQLAFRAILARALFQLRALTPDDQMLTVSNNTKVNSTTISTGVRAPAWSMHERIDFILQTSAQGAAAQCSGGDSGTVCGNDWGADEWDGTSGLGQDLSALNIFLANLPVGGRLATVNGSAEGAANASGGRGDNAAADEAASSEGAAGHVTVFSSVALLLVGVSSLMAML